MRPDVRAVLFDLDGTLVDSAPDLGGAANDLRQRRGRGALPLADYRPHAGSGARGMLAVAFGVAPGDDGYTALRDEFLAHYETRMLHSTRAFGPTPSLLAALDAARLPWGIVTNKAMRFAEPVARALALLPRCAALVAGDSTPHTKPHPAPLLEAARRLALAPQHCVYVGDDLRDMQAGRAAGMAVLAAAWGYLGPDAVLQDWPADAVLEHPNALLTWLELA
jgi:phosphoglycolate phosphatase